MGVASASKLQDGDISWMASAKIARLIFRKLVRQTGTGPNYFLSWGRTKVRVDVKQKKQIGVKTL
jgi:hypothetical protein